MPGEEQLQLPESPAEEIEELCGAFRCMRQLQPSAVRPPQAFAGCYLQDIKSNFSHETFIFVCC